MRNTTKLKKILVQYDCEFTMNEDMEIRIFLTDKTDIEQPVHVFAGANYSNVLGKAYSFYLKHLPKTEPGFLD